MRRPTLKVWEATTSIMADSTPVQGATVNTFTLMRLSHPWPTMVTEARERIQAVLARGCDGYLVYPERCECPTATVSLRDIRGSKRVDLQCDGCGRSLCTIAKTMFSFGWKDLPAWDEKLVEKRKAEREVAAEMSRAEASARWDAIEENRKRKALEREGYAEWCRTSNEWHELSRKVMWRSRGFCEACLANRAETVHHLTYDQGKLPPAWHLRAVCHICHDRLHADKRGLSDEWAPC